MFKVLWEMFVFYSKYHTLSGNEKLNIGLQTCCAIRHNRRN